MTTEVKAEFEEMIHKEQPEEQYVYMEKANIPSSVSDSDPEWSEFLLDQLSDSELINGAPTVDGLRRITENALEKLSVRKVKC